jgi:zinc finger BED domain-containing protein 5/7/8/9
LQGKERIVIDCTDKVKAFLMKLELWRGKVAEGKFDMFETLKELLTTNQSDQMAISDNLKTVIQEHLAALHQEISLYFSDVNSTDLHMIRNPFATCVQSIPEHCQEEFIDLVNDSTAKDLFQHVSLFQFWSKIMHSYPKIAYLALQTLLPFPSTYLCESAFSHLLLLKSKQRNRLAVEDDLRCALSLQ